MSCPANAFQYNGSLCACDPGYWRQGNGSCALFSGADWVTSSGVGASSTFLSTVLPLENIRRFTQSQAVLLEATVAVLLVWLLFCFLLRFAPLRSSRRPLWFRLRWWISRVDFFFSTQHWQANESLQVEKKEDNKMVVKRKTELGGTFSVASWILFVGLLSALLYQVITNGHMDVHRIKPASAPDLQSFINDMEFNITTVSNNLTDDKPRTLRGPELNVLKIHLFPWIYNYYHDLKLLQPLVHDFILGSSFSGVSDLEASLLNPKDGLINLTLHISFLSDYIVEIDKKNIFGPVGFLANVGGLYAVSIAIFLYILVQCEARVKKLRNEDSVMRQIRCQRRAQLNWQKLRKYVMYTWPSSNLDVKNISTSQSSSTEGCCFGNVSQKQQINRHDSLSIDKMLQSEKADLKKQSN
ncbi:hypothetical protein HPP92_021393 [Vanilla planifolia]|uniref:Uncharacterized protein n=1 Tax=Vanilla planifolia TaxID=51239 RepID=A0A835UIX5_VANPL|nr:hypothetical protein HPP92_021393 [Vanilla planifolia]